MKNRMIRGLIFAFALALLCSVALAEVKTTANVWMRTGPGLDYDTITSFAEGKSLKYLGEYSVDDRGVTWYKVASGENTGWVSSRYTELIGEEPGKNIGNDPDEDIDAGPDQDHDEDIPAPVTHKPASKSTPRPAVKPDVQTGVEPTAEPVDSLPDPDSEKLFGFLSDKSEPTAAPEQAEDAETPPAKPFELSGYYRDDLVSAANEIGLISYRQVESEAPYQYYNDSVILAGNQYVENIVIYGEGYELYGVYVGMDLTAARACLNAAGLDYVASMNGVSYEHRGTEDSTFIDEQGHDSVINVWVDEDNIVTEIDWSTYTG